MMMHLEPQDTAKMNQHYKRPLLERCDFKSDLSDRKYVLLWVDILPRVLPGSLYSLLGKKSMH